MKTNTIKHLLLQCVSLLCAVCITIGTCAMVFAENEKADGQADERLELLAALDILSKDSYSADSAVSKGNMAEALYRLAGAPQPPTEAEEAVFADVSAADEHAAAISWLKVMGILNGDENGNYNAGQSVSYPQAVKATAALLGYTPLAESYGGYPNGFMKAAAQNRLLKGINAQEGDITQAVFYHLLYNALFAKSLSVYSVGTRVEYMYSEDMYLYDAHDVYIYTGRVEATEYTGLYSAASRAASGRVTIGGKSFRIEADVFDSIGLTVKAYIREAKDSSGDTVLCLVPEDDGKTVTVMAEDIQPQTDKTTLHYYSSERDKMETMAISRGASVFYNNVFDGEINQIAAETLRLRDEQGEPLDAELTLVDTDDDNVADLVKITQYEIVTVGSVNGDEGLVSDAFNNTWYKLEEDNANVTCRLWRGDEAISVSDLKQWDTVSLARSRDHSVILGYASVKLAKGQINATSASAKTVTIGGVDYTYSHYFTKLLADKKQPEPKAGNTASLLLDVFGRIACYQYGMAVSASYGYLVNAKTGSGLSTDVQLRLFTAKDDFEVFSLADRVSVNDVSRKKDLWKSWTEIYSGASVIPQLVSYAVNDKGEINRLDTADTTYKNTLRGYNSDRFSLDFEGSVNWKSTGVVSGRYLLPGSAILFSVPADVTDEGAFSCSTPSQTLPNDYKDTFKLYDATEFKVAAVGVIAAGSASEKFHGTPALVKQIVATLSESGQDTHRAYLLQDGKERTVEAKDDTVMAGVKAGDVIKYNVDAAGRAKSVLSVFSYKGAASELYCGDFTSDNSGAGTQNYSAFVMPWNISNTNIEVTLDAGITEETPMSDNKTRLYLFERDTASNIYIFNADKGTVQKGSIADIKTIHAYGAENASRLFMTGSYYGVSVIVIYE